MRNLRILGSMLAAAVLIAGCGSSAGPTDAAATQNNGNPPATTDSGGGGGTGGAGTIDTSHGKAHVEVSGAKSWSGDLGFFTSTSQFVSSGSESALLYFLDSGSTSLSLSISPGQGIVIFASAEFGATILPVNGVTGTCTITTTTLDSGSASGTFKCEHVAIVNADTVIGEGSLSGSFEAHA
jgi:hypothetical protein